MPWPALGAVLLYRDRLGAPWPPSPPRFGVPFPVHPSRSCHGDEHPTSSGSFLTSASLLPSAPAVPEHESSGSRAHGVALTINHRLPGSAELRGVIFICQSPPGGTGLEGEALHSCGIRRGAKEGELGPPPPAPCPPCCSPAWHGCRRGDEGFV